MYHQLYTVYSSYVGDTPLFFSRLKNTSVSKDVSVYIERKRRTNKGYRHESPLFEMNWIN